VAKRLSSITPGSSNPQLPTLRQTAVTGWTGMGTASATATLGMSPVSGNLLVFTFTCLVGSSNFMTAPAGSTLLGQINSTVTLGGNEVQLGVAYRDVLPGDGTAWVIDSPYLAATAYGYGLCVREIATGGGRALSIAATLTEVTGGLSGGNAPPGTAGPPNGYPALSLGCGVGFTNMGGGTPGMTQVNNLPTSGWTIDQDQNNGSYYGEQFDAYSTVGVAAADVGFAGGNFTTVNASNPTSCWASIGVNEL
jgi:hypothetical protein